LLAILIALLAPIMLGGFRPRFWYGLESLVFLLFSIFCLARVVQHKSVVIRDYKLIYLLLIAWLAWPLIQLIPLPASMVEILSNRSYTTYRLAQPDSPFLTLSTQKFATADEFLKRLMYVCMFTMMLFLLRHQIQLRVAIVLIAVFALLHSFYVFIEYAADPEAVVRSTYTNRNHFALYITMSLSLMIGVCLSILSESGFRGLYVLLNGQLLGMFGIILVLLTVLMFTQSRGAAVSFIAAMVLTWLILGATKVRGESSRGHHIFFLVSSAVVTSILILGVSDLFSKFTAQNIFGDERWMQWRDSLRLAVDYWLTGSGAGTYEFVFPAYKSAEYRPLVYHHVHNDYIETICNEGVIGLTLFSGIFLSWLIIMRRTYRSRRDPFIKGISFGICLAVMTAVIHAFFDFNIQVPANTLFLFTFMGIGLATINMNRTLSVGVDT
jgi:O-antigen ligase